MTDTLAEQTQSQSDRRPGRPWDTSLEATVLAATADLLLERDTKDVTIAAITERSGISRPGVYRRWTTAGRSDSPPRWTACGPTSNWCVAPHSKRSSTATNSPRSPPRGWVGTLVKKRVAMGLENEARRSLSWDRYVSRRRVPIADEIRRGIATGEIDSSVDVEAMIDLINGLLLLPVRGPRPPQTRRRHRPGSGNCQVGVPRSLPALSGTRPVTVRSLPGKPPRSGTFKALFRFAGRAFCRYPPAAACAAYALAWARTWET